jgi:hypothetical protein
MQKARRHPDHSRLRPLVSAWFQGLFTPLVGVLFTFPSRYWFTIGLLGVFSLTGWCRQIHAGFLRSRATQDSNQHNIASAYGTITLYGRLFQNRSASPYYTFRRSYNPIVQYTMVWAISRSLATTCKITIVFFSCGYLDVSVPRVHSLSTIPSSTGWVAPFGHLRINARLQLPLAFRSLPRPSSPPRA